MYSRGTKKIIKVVFDMTVYVVEKEEEWYDNIVNLGIYADYHSAELGIEKDIEYERLYHENIVTKDNYAIVPQVLIKYK